MDSFTNLSAIPADRAALTRQILHLAGLNETDTIAFDSLTEGEAAALYK